MKVQIQEATTSTPKRPLWIWRVWRDGRMMQGFSPSMKEAEMQAELAQFRAPGR